MAIMKSMNSTWGTDEAGYEFARTLHDTWGVGHADCDDGVVLVVSIDDRRLGISSGKGVKNRLNEEQILDEMKPFLRQREYAAGVRRGVFEIGKGLNEKRHNSQLKHLIPVGFLAIFASCIG